MSDLYDQMSTQAEEQPRRRSRMERLHGAQPAAPQETPAQAQGTRTVVRQLTDSATDDKGAAVFGPNARQRSDTVQVNPAAQGVPVPAALRNRNQQQRQGGTQVVPQQGGSFGARRGTGPTQRAEASPEENTRAAQSLQQVLNTDAYATQRNEKRRSRWPLVLVIILLVLALAVVGLLMIPDDATGFAGTIKQRATSLLSSGGAKPTSAPAPQADNLSAAPTSGTAPMTITFNLVTRGQVDAVRLVDANGDPLQVTVMPLANADNTIWTLNLVQQTGYNGTVQAQLLSGEEWIDTGRSVTLQIAEPDSAGVVPATTDQEPQVLDLSTTNNLTASAPVTIDFTVTTTGSVDDVRLVDDEGEELDARAILVIPGTTERIWTMSLQLTTPFSGEAHVQLLHEDMWVDTDVSRTLAITGSNGLVSVPGYVAAAATEEITFTPAPTQYIATLAPSSTPAPAQRLGLSAINGTSGQAAEEASNLPPAEEDPDAPIGETDPDMPEDASTEPTGEPEPTATPGPTEAPHLTVSADSSADPKLIKTSVIYEGESKKALSQYQRDMASALNLPDADNYTSRSIGVLTFRGTSFRQNGANGTVSGSLSSMNVLWTKTMGSLKSSGSTVYYGAVYPSQPAIIQWSTQVRAMSNMYEDAKNTTALREVIVGGDDGVIYFLNLASGEATRDPINVGYPLRGAPSIAASGFPFMAVGQYARKMASGTGKIGLRTYNLLNGKAIELINGLDTGLNRPYYEVGSFNTSPLIDRNADTMVSIGTNGMLYVTRLGSEMTTTGYTVAKNSSLMAQSVMLKAKASGEADKATAVESAVAGYQNYVFYADMGGYLRCVDTTTMTTLWAVSTGDAVQAAVALDLDEDGNLWLYTANTLQNRSKGNCAISRYNALTGALVWQKEISVAKPKNNPYIAGVMASPIIGRGALNDRIYVTVNGITAAGAEQLGLGNNAVTGAIIALNKADGSLAAAEELDTWSYSSPVAVYTAEGAGQIIQADNDGKLRLMNADTLDTISFLQLDGTISASPAVYRNTLVICTTGKGTSAIYGIALE